jgi:DNA-binding response OmpR family regulator
MKTNKKIKILLVEDDTNLGFIVQDNLKSEGFEVILATDGEQALLTYKKYDFDICILDIMLPKYDGFSIAKDIRKTNSNIPILFLSAKAMIEDKIEGFNSGGDDYLTKPFSMAELVLRIKSLLKRIVNIEKSINGYQLGNIFFDIINYKLISEKQEKKLTKKEAEILKLLCKQKNNVIERDIILKYIWGNDSYFNGRSLDVFITKLRKYLSSDSSISITNVHGVGFCLKTDNKS